MNLVKKFFCVVLALSVLMTGTSVEAANVVTYGSYSYTTFAEQLYETTGDSVAIHSEPAKKSSVIGRIYPAAKYFYAIELNNGVKNHIWMEVTMEDGTKGYVYSGNCKKHEHEYTILAKASNGYYVEICPCGYCRINNEEDANEFDLAEVGTALIEGNFSDSSVLNLQEATAVAGINTAYDYLNAAVCGTGNLIGCAALTIINLAMAIRDESADIYYCINDNCDVLQTTLDTVSLVGTGVNSVTNGSAAIKNAKIHVAYNAFADIESNRAFKVINNLYSAKKFTRTVDVISYMKMWGGTITEGCNMNNCTIVSHEYKGEDNGTEYCIRYAYDSDLVVTAENGGYENDANVYLSTFVADDSQIFYLDDLGNGYYRIVNKAGKALDVEGTFAENETAVKNTNVHMWEVDDATIRTQSWKLQQSDDGYILIPQVANNLALDVEGTAENATIGTNIHVYSCTMGNRSTQLFYLESVN